VGAAGWRAVRRPADLYTASGLAAALARAAGVEAEPRPNSAAYFHPIRQARLEAGEGTVGWAGELHPLVLRALSVTPPVAAVVMDLEALLAAAPREPAPYRDILTVPVSTRDVAVVVPETVPAADLVAAARAAGGDELREVRVFDRYAGEQVEPGHVSLALRLTLVDPERTLTDEQIEAAVERVRAALEGAGARPREGGP
jgi:phenylalanyl-tRNA synthetase beta chain